MLYKNEFQVDRPSFLGGGSWNIRKATELTVIFGRNGAGKSILLRTLRTQNTQSSHYAAPERSGEFTFDIGLAQGELKAEQRRGRRMTNLVREFYQEAISRLISLMLRRGSIRSETVPVFHDRIERLMDTLLPDFNFRIGTEAMPLLITRLDPIQSVTRVDELSSGEAQILGLGLDLITIAALWELENQTTRLMYVDEPDLHLHPDLQQHLANFLALLAEEYKVQMLIATHSTTLLAALGHFGGYRTSVLFLNNHAEEQRAIPFSKYHLELSTCLGGHALMGPLFAVPLLLVEGDDDYRVWATAARSGSLRVAVLPANGDEIENSGRALEQLLTALLAEPTKPSAYLLMDRDNRGEPSIAPKHVSRMRLTCHELENLYLTDEILTTLGTNWADAKEEIKRRAVDFGEKETSLTAIVEQDRKTVDLKGLVEELTRILDRKKVDWRLRLGKLLGKSRPTGQLAEFIGARVLNALWPTEVK